MPSFIDRAIDYVANRVLDRIEERGPRPVFQTGGKITCLDGGDLDQHLQRQQRLADGMAGNRP